MFYPLHPIFPKIATHDKRIWATNSGLAVKNTTEMIARTRGGKIVLNSAIFAYLRYKWKLRKKSDLSSVEPPPSLRQRLNSRG